MTDIIYIRRNLQGMSILGLWDVFNIQNPVTKILFNVYGKFCYSILTCFNITQFIEMYSVKDDMLLLMQNAGVSLLYALIVVKAYTLMFRQERIGELLDKMRHEEAISLKKNEKEVKIYQQFVDENWFVTKGFTLVCFSTLIMFYIARPTEYFVMGPQKINHYKVPMVFSSWFPFDKYKSGNFLTAYIIQIIASSIGTYYVAMSDTFIVSLMIFAIGQLKMIQCAIRNLHNMTEKEEKMLDKSGLYDLYEKTVEIVKHHCRIIDYLEDLDGLINPIMFLNFFVCSLMIGSVGLEGIMAGPSIRLALSIYFMMALLIQLFLFYWHANEVTLESISVGYAVSDSKWYKFSTRIKNALLIVLMRSQKPCILSVGGFYAMSLATFLMILRATYSYLALFRQMYDRTNE